MCFWRRDERWAEIIPAEWLKTHEDVVYVGRTFRCRDCGAKAEEQVRAQNRGAGHTTRLVSTQHTKYHGEGRSVKIREIIGLFFGHVYNDHSKRHEHPKGYREGRVELTVYACRCSN
jgi:hypothetical protein